MPLAIAIHHPNQPRKARRDRAFPSVRLRLLRASVLILFRELRNLRQRADQHPWHSSPKYDRKMRYRRFGRTGWDVSEIGYGMWGMAGWTGSADEESLASLDRAVALGCNFFDTAWAYGDGHSEQLLGQLLKRQAGTRVYSATKIPPKNRRWPACPEYTLDDVYPPDYIREYTEKSLENIGVSTVDLQQFHVWSDTWAGDDRWHRAASKLKEEGLVRAIGISINRWQPSNVLRALDSGII